MKKLTLGIALAGMVAFGGVAFAGEGYSGHCPSKRTTAAMTPEMSPVETVANAEAATLLRLKAAIESTTVTTESTTDIAASHDLSVQQPAYAIE